MAGPRTRTNNWTSRTLTLRRFVFGHRQTRLACKNATWWTGKGGLALTSTLFDGFEINVNAKCLIDTDDESISTSVAVQIPEEEEEEDKVVLTARFDRDGWLSRHSIDSGWVASKHTVGRRKWKRENEWENEWEKWKYENVARKVFWWMNKLRILKVNWRRDCRVRTLVSWLTWEKQ